MLWLSQRGLYFVYFGNKRRLGPKQLVQFTGMALELEKFTPLTLLNAVAEVLLLSSHIMEPIFFHNNFATAATTTTNYNLLTSANI